VRIEEMIKEADHTFVLLNDHEYWLYRRESGRYFISTVSRTDWAKIKSATVQNLTFIACLHRISEDEWSVISLSPDFVENL